MGQLRSRVEHGEVCRGRALPGRQRHRRRYR